MASNKLKKVILLLAISIVLLVFVLLYALTQPKIISSTALYFLNKNSSSIIYKEVSIEKVHWISWNDLNLSNVRIKCKIKGVTYFLSSGEIRIRHWTSLFSPGPMLIDVNNLAVVSDMINASDIQISNKIYFHSFHYKNSQAEATVSRLEWGRYVLDDLKGTLEDENKHLTLSNIQGRLYGGHFSLKGAVEYDQGLSYKSDILLKGLHSLLLADANPVFEQVSAVIEGDIQISQNKGQGLQIQSHLESPLGGSMKASLLRYLAKYVPQRQQVEDLIQKDANVSLSKLRCIITSLDRERLASQVILNSSSLNLNMDVKFSIHIEGGIDRLLEYIHQ